jgi:hypothetical protein
MTDDDELVVVCARITTPLMLPDNATGKCSDCGHGVQFRPHAPDGRRLCQECALAIIDDDTEIIITPRMVEDAVNYFRKKLQ